MTIHDSTLLIFKAITAFVHDMNEIYGDRHKPLSLYAHLVEKTGIIHEEPIRKHLQIFRTFLTENEDAIMGRDTTTMKTHTIQYSEKVYIDMNEIWTMSEDSVADRESIWKHLLTLSALLNPSSQAKEILRREREKESSASASSADGVRSEDDFLSGLIDKVGKHIDPTSANPMDSMNSLMSSGVFGELMTSMDKGIENGTLDMQKMVGSLQKMIGSLSHMIETPPQPPSCPSSK